MHDGPIFPFLRLFLSFELKLSPPDRALTKFHARSQQSLCRHQHFQLPGRQNQQPSSSCNWEILNAGKRASKLSFAGWKLSAVWYVNFSHKSINALNYCFVSQINKCFELLPHQYARVATVVYFAQKLHTFMLLQVYLNNAWSKCEVNVLIPPPFLSESLQWKSCSCGQRKILPVVVQESKETLPKNIYTFSSDSKRNWEWLM